jgi:predicted nucleic acid-binding protein
MKVNELQEGEAMFIDANIFIFHVLSGSEYSEASTQLLERVERGEINAVTNVLVLNEVTFKILMAELSNYAKKFNIWVARKLLKSKEIAEKAYKPVKKYITYLRGLEMLEVAGITPRTAFSSVEIGERYGLLPSDSFHLATMKERGIKFIVTDDEDFKRVEWAVVVELEVIT